MRTERKERRNIMKKTELKNRKRGQRQKEREDHIPHWVS